MSEKTKSDLQGKIEKLEKAKHNVAWLLENADGLADMHGLAYWAGVVEKLRTEIKGLL